MHSHARARSQMLQRAIEVLARDERFVAAWLAGSFGRGTADEWSDLDLWVVVSDVAAETLCTLTSVVGAGTTPERLGLFAALGRLAIIHEQHGNAPPGGTFTSCVYADGGVIIDWTLVPFAAAHHSSETKPLFDRAGVPVAGKESPPSGAARAERLSERCAFFWMMAFPTAKALLRGDAARFHALLEVMCQTLDDVAALLAGKLPEYSGRGRAPFASTPEDQRRALVQVSERMEALTADLRAAGATTPDEPGSVLESWMEHT